MKQLSAAKNTFLEKINKKRNLSKGITYSLKEYIYLLYIQDSDNEKYMSHHIETCRHWVTKLRYSEMLWK